MLYISRRIWANEGVNYGVVDTDDGVEEIITPAALRVAVVDRGLDIKGVKCGYDLYNTPTRVVSIHPYLVNPSPLQVKTAMLKKVNVVTYKGVLVDIGWNGVPDQPMSIRLSDFGQTIGDFVVLSTETCPWHLTLIFDDKLKEISAQAFFCKVFKEMLTFECLGMSGLNLLFDMRELSNEELAANIYNQLFLYQDVPLPVRDRQERYQAYMRNRMPWGTGK